MATKKKLADIPRRKLKPGERMFEPASESDLKQSLTQRDLNAEVGLGLVREAMRLDPKMAREMVRLSSPKNDEDGDVSVWQVKTAREFGRRAIEVLADSGAKLTPREMNLVMAFTKHVMFPSGEYERSSAAIRAALMKMIAN